MTTPPTTAGWYPDPDGSGGQRYWDGAAWTDTGPDIADTPEREELTSAWPAELPPWPEDMTMPSWEDAGKIEPADEIAPEAPEAPDDTQVPDIAQAPEAAQAPDIAPVPPVVQAAEITQAPEVDQVPEFETTHDEPEPTYVAESQARADEPTAEVRWPQPPPAASAATTAPIAAAPTPTSPLKGYLIGVGTLLVVLVAVLVWALGFAGPDTETTGASGADESSETPAPAGAPTDSTGPSDAAAAEAGGAGGQVTDGDVTITSKGMEITPTVSAADNEMLTKSASGEFVVVRLTLLNNGELPATFLADQQVLNAGGQTYNAETESTFYLGGISAVLYPGTPVDVAFAYDVPPGTAPESVLVHGDLASEGAVLPLS